LFLLWNRSAGYLPGCPAAVGSFRIVTHADVVLDASDDLSALRAKSA
jgi:hypothetical protein